MVGLAAMFWRPCHRVEVTHVIIYLFIAIYEISLLRHREVCALLRFPECCAVAREITEGFETF